MTRLLLLGLNFAPEEIGIGHYSSQLVDYWLQSGGEADVVTAKPYYPQWATLPGFGSGWTREAFTTASVVRCPIYVPAKPTGVKRILHYASFAIASLVPTVAQAMRQRPDLVMTVAPSLLAAPVALLAAKVSGARSWLHVQDFEVPAAFATGLMASHGLAARLARRFERWVFGKFDTVSTISPQMCARLASHGVAPERIFELRNWADLDHIDPLTAPSPYRELWQIATPHVALYSGNIAAKQGLELIIEAARSLAHRTDLMFVICGDGADRAKIKESVAGLQNVQFHDLQPRERLNDLLGLASVHLLPQLESAADLVLPSKLANMLASGRPVVATAKPGTGLAAEVEGVGIVTPPGDVQAFVDAIENLLDNREMHRALSFAARARGKERWGKAAILDRFILATQARRIAPQRD